MVVTMKPIQAFSDRLKIDIRYVLTDIDDTLTCRGRLPAVVFDAMERLKSAGRSIVPITGRPAGWCDHMARMWPIDGVVGENGAFYFRYDDNRKKMDRQYWKSPTERERDRARLGKLKRVILKTVPGCRISADQSFREADLAIDYCEDVAPLPDSEIKKIVTCFNSAGAQAMVSSIHVNGWFGDYNKLAMARRMFEDLFGLNIENIKDRIMFVGDSPNDAPMFAFFTHSVGVANIRRFTGRLDHGPAWITRAEGGFGFAEMVDVLLS